MSTAELLALDADIRELGDPELSAAFADALWDIEMAECEAMVADALEALPAVRVCEPRVLDMAPVGVITA